jgi:hypothetical protein
LRRSLLRARAPRLGRVLCDANALIFHPATQELWERLNKSESESGDLRAAFLEIRADLVAYYENWLAILEECAGSITVSSAVLDCELSGGRFAGDRMRRYRQRAAPRLPPSGDILRSYDSRSTAALKNRVLRHLHERCRISDQLESEAKGLRFWIREALLKKPIWRQASKKAGLSWIDEDVLVNALAASAIGPVTILTNDRAMHEMARALRNALKDSSWPGKDRSEQQARWAEGMAARPFDTARWERSEGELWIIEAN